MRRQLILASYHLCTQGYPESFLKLSYSQRQKFQQHLQALAGNAQKMLMSLVEVSPASQALQEQEPDEEPRDDEDDGGDGDFLLEEVISEEDLPEDPGDLLLAPPKPLSLPERLARWQENLEKSIPMLLKGLSRDTNLALQRADIFPSHLPEAVLEVATEAEAAETAANSPNLLNLIVQTEDGEDEPGAGNVTRLVAVRLHLSEIEFGDAAVMSARHQIRNLSARLQKLGRGYHKKLRERAVLEAEAAWRASWFEENPGG